MSELKARRAYFSEDDYERGEHKICAKVSDCGYDRRNDWWSYAFEDEVYLKSEADKVIAHNKYKRCLAMAEWCNSEMGRETFACFRPRHTKEVWREEHKYWAKWRKIWFELYKKFK